jgi:hypothetical protein
MGLMGHDVANQESVLNLGMFCLWNTRVRSTFFSHVRQFLS